MHSAIRIGFIGDFNEQHRSHQALSKAIGAAGESVEGVWVPTDSSGNNGVLEEFDGLWCVPGMPYRNTEGVLAAIHYARVRRVPFLGTSAGFQYAVLEYARNALGMVDAEHQKINPKASTPLISPLGCALAGVKARVRFIEGSELRRAYEATESVEEYHCSFGINARYRRLIEGRDLSVSAVDDQNEIRAVELDGHPFFVATLFQPELRVPSPIVNAFVEVCERRRREKVKAAS